MNRKITYTSCLIASAFLLIGCAEVTPNIESVITEDSYGFWGGLWHGIIIPFSWIGSLFSDDIAIYAYNNNGGWYDFGFIIGLSVLGSGVKEKSK